MSDPCNAACWQPVTCLNCGQTKAPRGRDVGVYAASGYCSYSCEGYWLHPLPGHLWPNEARPEPRDETKEGT